MKKIVYLFLVLATPLFFTNCEFNPDDDVQVIQMLKNTNVEDGSTDQSYWNYVQVGTAPGEWSTDQYKSSSHSLQISCASSEPTNNGFWYQTITNNLPIGKKPILKAYLKTNTLSGRGVSISIRGDDTTTPLDAAEVFTSTESSTPITGTMDWTLFTIQLNEVLPSNIKSITVYLTLLPSTSGNVNFDDITLSYEE